MMNYDPGGSSSGASGGGDKYAMGLPPPPPAGATLPPSVKEQRERVREAMEEATPLRVDDVWYPTSARWLERWRLFVGYGDEGDSAAEADEGLHPGPMDNGVLAQKQRGRGGGGGGGGGGVGGGTLLELRKDLLPDVDFEYLPEAAYTLLKEWYSGGPDFPRSVITVGTGSLAEKRVGLYPFMVDVTCGDSQFHCGTSRERGRGQGGGEGQQQQRLMFQGDTPAVRLVREVCKAVGVEVEHAVLYLVEMPKEEEEEEGEEEVVGMEVCRMTGSGDQEGGKGLASAAVGNGRSSSGNSDGDGSNMDTDLGVDSSSLRPLQQQQSQVVVPLEMKKLQKEYGPGTTVEEIFHGQTGVRVFVEDKAWRFALKVGDVVDGRDDTQAWYDATVLEVLPPLHTSSSSSKGVPRVRIHFRCWESRWDMIYDVTSDALQPLFTKAPDWRHFSPGMSLEIRKSDDHKWYRATVAEVDEAKRQVLVRYMPGDGEDTWKAFDSEDICREGVHQTIQTADLASPTGNGTSSSGDSSGGLSSSTSSSNSSSSATPTSPSSSSSSSFAPGVGRVLGTGGGSIGSSSSSSSILVTTSNPSSSLYGGRGLGGASSSMASVSPGVVGLGNLGNTCFMNSMLQCLSNTGMLTEFFLSGQHEAQINEDNPLGKQGVLVRTYAKLLKDMWSGEHSPVYPSEFKRVISQYAPQFAGYQQHDSQELMNFLLDGLHEDLNRVRHKPYVAIRDYAGEPDGQFAAECWKRHLARNDSVVIDHCQGQYKSHLTCPKCGHESITFDPYMSLTLPLPVTCIVRVAFIFHGWPLGMAAPMNVAASLPSTATAAHLKAWVVENLCSPPFSSSSSSSSSPSSLTSLPTSASPLVLKLENSESMVVAEEEEEDEETEEESKQQKQEQARGESTQEGGKGGNSTSNSDAMMAVVEEKGEEGEAARRPSPLTINLVEILDRRVIKEFKDSDPISQLARTDISLQAFQLEHVPSPLPPPRITTTTPSSSSSWRPGKRDNSPSPPRLLGSRSKTPPPSLLPSSSSSSSSSASASSNASGRAREDWKEGDEVFVVATCLFGKARPSAFSSVFSKTYERFGPPVRFTLSSTRATNRQVHARVWAATQRFLKEGEGGDEEEDEAQAENGEGTERERESGKGSRVPYRVYVAKGGDGVGEEVLDDGGVFDVQLLKGKVLLVAFDNAVFGERVVKAEVDRKEAHASVRRMGMAGGMGEGRAGRKVIQLKQCLEKFSEREQLEETDPWFCPKCKEHVSAFKKMDVWSLPDVLILHLKRFSYVQGLYSGPTREKIEDLVQFPLEGLDMRDVMRGPVEEAAPPVYDLYAVSEHSGGLGGGHYTAVAKNFRDQRWYTFNDSIARPVAEENVEATLVTSKAYVLFYKRRQGSLKWAGARLPMGEGDGGMGRE